jgi:hypothetical protein
VTTSNDNKELAKIFRKLGFIEYVFKVKFNIPTLLTPTDLRGIEYLYRGLTEGEFVTRDGGINILIPKMDINWTLPPFSEPGVFPQFTKWYAADFFEGLQDLLGYRLLVGSTSLRLEKTVGDSQPLTTVFEGIPEHLAEVKFDVLDHQINIRYDKYADKGKKKLQEKLAQFKYQFLRDDPPELLALMDEQLQTDVNAEEANLIAMGWVQFNRLPDRYGPQDPEFDVVRKVWRVPVCLVYANGEGGEVGELIIEPKTGKVVSHTPLEVIRSKGKSLAEKIMHARETAPVLAGY